MWFYRIFFCLVLYSLNIHAQVATSGSDLITSGVPFLTINPGARSAAMGETGVATLPDILSHYCNPAKFSFLKNNSGINISYPFSGLLKPGWLSKIADKYNFVYLTGFKKINDNDAMSASFRYFSLGSINEVNEFGELTEKFSPEETAFDIGYSKKLNESLSGALSLRYIRSKLFGMKMVGLYPENTGAMVSADLAVYYYKESGSFRLIDKFTAGTVVQNLGGKITYNKGKIREFLPTALKIGCGYTKAISEESYLSFSIEAGKLLVPSSLFVNFVGDSTGVFGGTGYTSHKSVLGGILSSFSDARGGLKEELQEINLSAGAEYKLAEWLMLRSGFFYESKNKGNRRYSTFGGGLKYSFLEMDISWLIPTEKNHPMEGTKRISLSLLL